MDKQTRKEKQVSKSLGVETTGKACALLFSYSMRGYDQVNRNQESMQIKKNKKTLVCVTAGGHTKSRDLFKLAKNTKKILYKTKTDHKANY